MSARCRAAGAAALGIVLALGGLGPAAAAPGDSKRLSVSSAGLQGNDQSDHPDLTPSGRHVAFASRASTLVPGDTNAAADVFVRDRDADGDGLLDEPGAAATERISVGAGGAQALGASGSPSISASGRWVAFESSAPTLVPGDSNAAGDVFVRDRTGATTVRVSVSGTGAEGAGPSGAASISADGRYVAFESLAANLVAGDTNAAADVFVHDRDTDADGVLDEPGAIATVLASVGTGGQGSAASTAPSLAPGGRHVAFETASALEGSDANGRADVYVRDLVSGTTARVSVGPGGVEGNAASTQPDLSADGRRVAFLSEATSWFAGGVPAGVVVRDRDTDADGVLDEAAASATVRASVSTYDFVGTNTFSTPTMRMRPAISPDGRAVAFVSSSPNLIDPPKTNDCGYFGPRPCTDVWVRDLSTDTTFRASVGPVGREGDGDSFSPSISADGVHVVFSSRARTFDPADDNACVEDYDYVQPCRDVYAYEVDRIVPAAPAIAAPASGSEVHAPSVTLAGTHPEPGDRIRVFEGGVRLAQAVVDVANGWTATVPAADGTHLYTARAVDPYGNLGPASPATTVLVDTVPEITAAAPYASTAFSGAVCPDMSGRGSGYADGVPDAAAGTLWVEARATENAPFGEFLPNCKGIGATYAGVDARLLHEIPVTGPGSFEIRLTFSVATATVTATHGDDFLDGALAHGSVTATLRIKRCQGTDCTFGTEPGEIDIRTADIVHSEQGGPPATYVLTGFLRTSVPGPARITLDAGFRGEAAAWGTNAAVVRASGAMTSAGVFVDPL